MKQIHPIRKYFLTIWSMIRSNIRDYGMYIAFIVIAIAFSIMTNGLFLQPRNFSNLLDQTAYVAVLAVGMTLVIVTRMIDLSVGYLGAFMGAYVVVSVEVNGQSLGVALLGALAIAIFVGIIKGFAVAKLHVPAFVVTLAGMFIFKGFLMLETNTRTIPTSHPFFNRIGIEYLSAGTIGSFDIGIIAIGSLIALLVILKYAVPKAVWEFLKSALSGLWIVLAETPKAVTWVFKHFQQSITWLVKKTPKALVWLILSAPVLLIKGIYRLVVSKELKTFLLGLLIFLLKSVIIATIIGGISLGFAYIVIHPFTLGPIGLYGLFAELIVLGFVIYWVYRLWQSKDQKQSFIMYILNKIGYALLMATIIGGVIILFKKPKKDIERNRSLTIMQYAVTIIGYILLVGIVLGFPLAAKWVGEMIQTGSFDLLTVEVGIVLLLAVVYNAYMNRKKKERLGIKLEHTSIFVSKTLLLVGIIMWLTYTLASFRGISYLLLITIIVVIVYVFLTTQTVIGRRVYAVGGNPEAAELSGISVAKIIIFVMISMGILAMISGIMYVTRTQNTSPNHGPFWELYAIAAAFIGGTSTEGGSGKIVNSVIGAVVIMGLKNGMALAGFDSNIEPVVLGSVLLLAVVFDIYTKNVRTIDMVGVYMAKVDNRDRMREAKDNYRSAKKALRVARNQHVEDLIDYEYRFMNAEGQLKRIKDRIRGSKEEDFC